MFKLFIRFPWKLSQIFGPGKLAFGYLDIWLLGYLAIWLSAMNLAKWGIPEKSTKNVVQRH